MDGKWTERVRKGRHAGQCNGYIKINSRQKKSIPEEEEVDQTCCRFRSQTQKDVIKRKALIMLKTSVLNDLKGHLWCCPTLQKDFRATEISPGELEEKLAQRQVREETLGVVTGQPQRR